MRLLLAFLAIVFIADSSHGRAEGVPPLINYQGRLTDQAATPLAAGNYGIQFRLWDSPTATNSTDLIWGQQQNVIVFTNGVFNIILGGTGTTLGGSANDLTSSFGSNNRYLGITIVSSNDVTISSASEILPRQQLLSVPFAVQAQQAQRATTADVAQTVAQPTAAMLAPPGAIV